MEHGKNWHWNAKLESIGHQGGTRKIPARDSGTSTAGSECDGRWNFRREVLPFLQKAWDTAHVLPRDTR